MFILFIGKTWSLWTYLNQLKSIKYNTLNIALYLVNLASPVPWTHTYLQPQVTPNLTKETTVDLTNISPFPGIERGSWPFGHGLNAQATIPYYILTYRIFGMQLESIFDAVGTPSERYTSIGRWDVWFHPNLAWYKNNSYMKLKSKTRTFSFCLEYFFK